MSGDFGSLIFACPGALRGEESRIWGLITGISKKPGILCSSLKYRYDYKWVFLPADKQL
jgi:hypothetical protein